MVKSNLYSNIFNRILLEDNIAGEGGAFGTPSQAIYDPNTSITSGDKYAPGDSRNIFGYGKKFPILRRNIIKPIKKRRKKRKKRS